MFEMVVGLCCTYFLIWLILLYSSLSEASSLCLLQVEGIMIYKVFNDYHSSSHLALFLDDPGLVSKGMIVNRIFHPKDFQQRFPSAMASVFDFH